MRNDDYYAQKTVKSRQEKKPHKKKNEKEKPNTNF